MKNLAINIIMWLKDMKFILTYWIDILLFIAMVYFVIKAVTRAYYIF